MKFFRSNYFQVSNIMSVVKKLKALNLYPRIKGASLSISGDCSVSEEVINLLIDNNAIGCTIKYVYISETDIEALTYTIAENEFTITNSFKYLEALGESKIKRIK